MQRGWAFLLPGRIVFGSTRTSMDFVFERHELRLCVSVLALTSLSLSGSATASPSGRRAWASAWGGCRFSVRALRSRWTPEESLILKTRCEKLPGPTRTRGRDIFGYSTQEHGMTRGSKNPRAFIIISVITHLFLQANAVIIIHGVWSQHAIAALDGREAGQGAAICRERGQCHSPHRGTFPSSRSDQAIFRFIPGSRSRVSHGLASRCQLLSDPV